MLFNYIKLDGSWSSNVKTSLEHNIFIYSCPVDTQNYKNIAIQLIMNCTQEKKSMLATFCQEIKNYLDTRRAVIRKTLL